MNKSYLVKWTKTAKADIEEIVAYIAVENVNKALQILDQLEERIKMLKKFPNQGRVIPELAPYNYFIYRELIKAPWRIIYKVEAEIVYIMAILDGRRNVEDILLKRLIDKKL